MPQVHAVANPPDALERPPAQGRAGCYRRDDERGEHDDAPLGPRGRQEQGRREAEGGDRAGPRRQAEVGSPAAAHEGDAAARQQARPPRLPDRHEQAAEHEHGGGPGEQTDPERADQQQRPCDVELLLEGEAPRVPEDAERVAPKVGVVEQRGHGLGDRRLTQRKHHGDEYDQRGQEPPRAAEVEGWEPDPAPVPFADQQARDEVAREREEQAHADDPEPMRDADRHRVAHDHQQHRHAAQRIEARPMPERPARDGRNRHPLYPRGVLIPP